LELEYRFCDVKGEIRFSFDEDIRNEIVKRILILNQKICESGASNNLPDRAGGAVGKNLSENKTEGEKLNFVINLLVNDPSTKNCIFQLTINPSVEPFFF